MSINPLIPYIPAFLSFFIYGYLSGFLFLLWKRSLWGYLLKIIFWEAYIVWCIFISMFLGVQETSDQTWFVLGVALAFLRPLLQSVAVQNFIEDIRHVGHFGTQGMASRDEQDEEKRRRQIQQKPNPRQPTEPANKSRLQLVQRHHRTDTTRRASPPRIRSPRPTS